MTELLLKKKSAALLAVLALAFGATACEGRVSGDVDRNERGDNGGEDGGGVEGEGGVDVDVEEGEGDG